MAKQASKEVSNDNNIMGKMETDKESGKTSSEKIDKNIQENLKESMYSLNELAANAGKIFNTRQECVMAALKAAGKSKYTVFEAKEIVGKFLKKEVR